MSSSSPDTLTARVDVNKTTGGVEPYSATCITLRKLVNVARGKPRKHNVGSLSIKMHGIPGSPLQTAVGSCRTVAGIHLNGVFVSIIPYPGLHSAQQIEQAGIDGNGLILPVILQKQAQLPVTWNIDLPRMPINHLEGFLQGRTVKMKLARLVPELLIGAQWAGQRQHGQRRHTH